MEKMNAVVLVFLLGAVGVLSYLYYEETKNDLTLKVDVPYVSVKKD